MINENIFTKGGFGALHLFPDYYPVGFYGWTGWSGSQFVFNLETKESFCYVPCFMDGPKDERGVSILEKLTISELNSERMERRDRKSVV